MAVLELDGLTKDYGSVRAADEVTFTVESGEIFGFLGPNGAGKTTTIRLLLGVISPTAGTAYVLGHDVTDRRGLIEAKRRLGYLSDTPGFDEDATGRAILDLHASIKGDERSDALLDLFDPPLDRQIRDYSRGNVQKLGLVTAFMHEPELVILDEPTSGLDPLMKQRFADFLRSERERGVTVFFSSHSLGEVRRLCDRVGIIRQGRLVTVDPVEALVNRSGKVVRIDSAEAIPRSVLDIDGVYDLESSLAGDGPELTPSDNDRQLGQSDTTRASTAPDRNPEADRSVSAERFTECTFTFTGDINTVLDRLSEYELLDISIEEAPLEDVFMRFYGDDDE